MMPAKYGFCMPAAQGHVAPGPDISPHISWSKGQPAPSPMHHPARYRLAGGQREKMNKEGETLTARCAEKLLPLDPGRHSGGRLLDCRRRRVDARVPHGKPATPAAAGGMRGLNDFNQSHRHQRRVEGTILRL